MYITDENGVRRRWVMSEKYCNQHGRMNPCIVCDEGYLVEGIRKSDERIRELKQKLAAAESKIAETEALPDWAKVGDGTLHSAIDYWYERATVAEYRLAAAESIKQQLARFFHDAIELSFDGRDFDGGEMQERALGLGLIVETTPPGGEIGTWYEIAPGVESE